MSSHGCKELDSHNADSIFDEELANEGLGVVNEYASDDGGGVPVEEEEGRSGSAYAKDAAWMTFLKWNMNALCMSG
jgi:hypothetical protein